METGNPSTTTGMRTDERATRDLIHRLFPEDENIDHSMTSKTGNSQCEGVSAKDGDYCRNEGTENRLNSDNDRRNISEKESGYYLLYMTGDERMILQRLLQRSALLQVSEGTHGGPPGARGPAGHRDTRGHVPNRTKGAILKIFGNILQIPKDILLKIRGKVFLQTMKDRTFHRREDH